MADSEFGRTEGFCEKQPRQNTGNHPDPLADLERDAMRWRALMRCGRIKMQGSAGVDPHTLERRNDSNVHFGAEFWPEPLPQDYRDAHPESAFNYDRSTRWGIACLIALADAILELESAPLPPHSASQPHVNESEVHE